MSPTATQNTGSLTDVVWTDGKGPNLVGSVVFIDPSVPEIGSLLKGVRSGHLAVVLDGSGDGLRQICEILTTNRLSALRAIHIVSHGTPGQIQLGATLLNERGLKSHAALLSEIGASLAPGGDILLFACDVARGVAGRQFVEELSVYTGANVAAASHPVGASERGASWELDVSTGPIAAGLAFGKEAIEAYRGVLVAPTTDLNGAGVGDDETASFTEQTPVVIAPAATIADVDSTTLVSLTATLTARPDGDGVESLSLNAAAQTAATGAGLTVLYTAATGVLLINGPAASLATYQTILQGIVYNNTSDTPTTTDRNVDVVVNDGTDPSAVNSVTIGVTAVNDAPTTDLNGGVAGDDVTASFTEQTPVVIAPAATIADTDSATLVSLTATLTARPDGDGVESLSLNATAQTAATGAGLTVLYTAATGVLLINGPAASLATYQTILQGIVYNNTSDTPTTTDRNVDVVVNDGTDPSAVNSVTIGVTAVNDAPTTDLNGGVAGDDETASFTEQTPVAIAPAATIADVDSATLVSLTATLTARPDGNGVESLSLNATAQTAATGAGLTVLYTAGTGVLLINGPAASLATYQTILQGIVYNNTSDTPTTTPRNVDVVVNDGTDPSAVNSVTISVTAANDAPVLDAAKTPVLNAENEDAVAPVGAVGTLVSNLVNLTPPAGGLDNVTDPDSANIGIALTGTTGGGTWFYSLNNGGTWLAVGAVTDASARLLAADASTRLYYQPVANANGTETITFRAWDQFTGSNGASGVNVSGANNGGATAFSAVSDTANLTITAVNDGPTNTVPAGPLAAQEDTNLSVTGISVTDIDAAPQHVSVTLSVLHGSLDVRTDVAGGVDAAHVSGDTTGSVTLTGTPTEINTTLGAANGLVYRGNLNYFGPDTLTVNTNDLGHTGTGGPLSDSDPIAINVAQVVANTLSATQTTTLATDNDGDGVIDPGDHVTVTVQIANNSTTTAATGVSFNETLSGLTQNGAVHITPIAFDDLFTGVVGNSPIHLNVLANDIDPDSSTPLSNVGLTITSVDTTGTNGTVTIDAGNTTVTFTPTTGFNGTTTFKYFTTDADGKPSNEPATVTVQVNGGLVWYVDANASSVGQDGSFAHAFTSLTQLNGVTGDGTTGDDVDGAGDTIFVYSDTTTPITYTGGIVLEGTQKLIGDGVAFSVNGIAIGHATDDAAHAPTITSTTAGFNDVTLASGNTVRGLTLGNTNGGVALSGTNFGTLTVDNVAINTNNTAISLNTGAFAAGASFSSVSVSTAGITDVNLTNVTGTVDLGSGTMAGQFAVSGGTVNATYSGSITQSGAAALVNVSGGHSGTLTFQTGTLSATNGTGLQFDNADGTYNFNGTTTLNGGDAGIDILNGSTGTFSFGVNTSITNPTGTAFNLSGATASNANVTYSGSITDNSGFAVNIDNHDAGTVTFQTGTITSTGTGLIVANSNGGTINFNSISTSLTTGASKAVTLDTNNTGGTINFNHGATGNGLDISTTTGTGFSALGGGTISVVGSGNTINSSGGTALDVNAAIGASGLTFDSTTAGGGTNGIKLVGTTGGAIALGSGSISGTTGAAFLVGDNGVTNNAGGTSAITYAGTISSTGTARTVDIEDRAAGAGNITLSGTISHASGNGSTIFLDQNAAGTILFSAANMVANSGTADAIHITLNGATVNFTGGGMDIDTTSGAGFLATGGGTVSVTGTANTITSTTGTALNITNTTIGANDVTFQSISAGTAAGSAGDGIILDTTGTLGGLHVTGNGTNIGATGGGVIQHKTGADGSTTAGNGIYLNNTSEVSLNGMLLNDFDNHAIFGLSVNGFKLTNSTISGVIGTTSGANDLNMEAPIQFGKTAPSVANGFANGSTALLDNVNISGGIQHNVEIYQDTGTFNLTISNSNIHDNSVALGSDGVNIELTGTAHGIIKVNNTTFDDNKSQALQANALGSSFLELTLANNTILTSTQGNEGFILQNGASGDLTVAVTSNTFTGINGTNILVGNVAGNATSAAELNATVSGNVMTLDGPAVNRTLLAFFSSTAGQVSTSKVLIDGNTINTIADPVNGLAESLFVSTPDANTSPLVYATVSNNVVNIDDNNHLALRGIAVQSTQTTSTMHADVRGNDVNYLDGAPAGVNGIRVRQVNPATLDLEPGVGGASAAAVLAANNPLSTTEIVGTVTVSANNNTALLPSNPATPTLPSFLLAASGGVEAAQWQLIGTANFSGEGSNDQLWLGQNGLLRTDIFNADGELANWYILGQLQTGWNVIGTANFNGDAISDLLLRHDSGAFQAALIQDHAIAATVDLALVDGTLQVVSPPAPDAPPADPAPQDPAPQDPAPANTGSAPAVTPPASTASGTVETHLTQAELDSIVNAAIARWEATGLTAEQSSYLHNLTFSIDDMANLNLGSALPGHITIDSDAAGYGWYLDAAPADDVEFGNALSATRLQTDGFGVPAGHIDLLSAVMHEMGHQLGLEDTYALGDQSSLMYGYLVTGERRLPAEHQADGATPGSITSEEFAVGPVSLGTLPANRTVTITFDATVDTQTNKFITNPSNVGTVTSSFPSVNTNTNVTTLDSLALGNLIFNDVNGNGVFDSGLGETGIDGVALTLFADTNSSGGLDAGDVQLATGVTIAGGLYSFIGLAPGDYIVRVDQSNFAGVLAAFPNSSPGNPDPDNNTDNDDNGGVISGNGVASLAITLAYNTEPTAGTGNDTNDTLDFGFLSIPPNAAPVVTAGSTVTFFETGGGPAVTLEPLLTADDPDGTDLDGATVTITDFVAGDVLAFTPGFGITGGFAAGVLTLTGTASEADYQTVLRSVTYRSTSDNPDTFGTDTSRTISWTVNDGTQDSVAASTTVNITAENDAPALANVAPSALYIPGSAFVTLSSGATVSDVDDTNLESATVTVSDFVAGDELSVNGVLNSGAPVNGISWTYNGAGLLTLTGPSLLANYQSLLDQVQYRSTAGDPTVGGTDAQRTIQWVINDGDVGSTAATTTITIDAAPVLDLDVNTGGNDFTTTFTEGAPAPVSIASLVGAGDSVTDTDDANMESATIILTNPQTGDTLAVSGALPGLITVFSQTASQIVLTGSATKADYAAAIKLITFTNNSQNPDTTARIINSVVNDGDTNSNIAVTTIQVVSVNDDPVNTVPGLQVTSEDTNVVFTGATAISISDVDGGTGDETTTLSVSHGTLTFSGSSVGLTSFTNGLASITLTGSVAEINTALSTLTYTPTADYNGTDQLTVLTNDNGNTGTPGALTDSDTVDITINAVADVVTDNLTTNEDNAITANVLTGTNGASADNFENGGRTVTAVTQGLHGSVGFLANGDVTYTPNADFNGADTFTYTVTSGGVTETGTVNVSINAVNDAPVLNAAATPVLNAENEDAGAPVNGTAVGTLVSSLVDLNPPAGGNDNVTDIDAGPVTGIALTSTAGGGTWHYSIDGGATWNAVGVVSDGSARLLAADLNTRLYYQPATDVFGTISPAITFRAWDQSTGTNGQSGVNTVPNGNTTPFSTATDTADITINSINDAPVFAGLNNNPAFIENGASVVLDDNATISDVELDAAPSYDGAQLTLVRHTGPDPDDVFGGTGTLDLTSSNGLGENVSLDGGGTFIGTADPQGDGTFRITFNANATAADVNSVLQQIIYSNVGDNPPASLVIDYTFSDANGIVGGQPQGGGPTPGIVTGSITVSPITQIDDAPTVSNVAVAASYTLGSSGVAVSPGLAVSDPDATPPSPLTGIANATVKIQSGFLAGDELFVNLPTSGGFFIVDDGGGPVVTNISVQSNVLGQMVLSGNDTVAHYQAVLDAVSYRSFVADPSNGGANPTRTITWQVNDGALNSQTPDPDPLNLVNATILHFNAPPTLDLDVSGAGTGFTTTFTERDPPVRIVDTDVLISDPDNAALATATIVLTNAKPSDVLSIAGALPGGIDSSIDTSVAGQITVHLSNSASLADYQTALGQVRFNNTSVVPDETDRDITIVVNDGDGNSNVTHATVHVVDLITVHDDFNADGTSDVLWRHNNGFVAEWQMGGGQLINNVGVGTPAPVADYQFQDTGDFNADGHTDILWRHNSGQVELWTMNGGQIVSNQAVAVPGNDWHGQGVADFGGDGKSDVLWRNDSGQFALWTMNGGQITNNQSIATVANTYHTQGLLDANGDGKSDVLLRHDSGQVVLWTMDGAQITNNQAIANVGLDWNIAGTGDFDGDGKDDILWRNDSGQVVIWKMDGAQIVSNTSVATPGNDWKVQDVADYNGDTRADILWRHDSGQVVVWEMNGSQIVSNHEVSAQGQPAKIGLEWQVQQHHYDLF